MQKRRMIDTIEPQLWLYEPSFLKAIRVDRPAVIGSRAA